MTMTQKRSDSRDKVKSDRNDRRKLLTCIRDAYTLAATPDPENEVDEIAVRTFLETLAEAALAIASRKQAGRDSR